MSDLEMPSCWHESKPKARKRHRCCECRGHIEKGEVYHRLDGIWDGRASSFKTCLDCHELRKDITGVHTDEIGLGMLDEWVSETDDVRAFTRLISIGYKRGHPIREGDLKWLREVCGRPAIQCAAITHEGSVYFGWAHCAIGQDMVKYGYCPRPFPGGPAQGFITTEGAFVSRERALQIALACGQVLPGKHQHATQLFSEDLRYDKK
jgi:hypothetical protein